MRCFRRRRHSCVGHKTTGPYPVPEQEVTRRNESTGEYRVVCSDLSYLSIIPNPIMLESSGYVSVNTYSVHSKTLNTLVALFRSSSLVDKSLANTAFLLRFPSRMSPTKESISGKKMLHYSEHRLVQLINSSCTHDTRLKIASIPGICDLFAMERRALAPNLR